MPYELRKQDGKYCVFNKETGANKGCSDTEEKGKAHMRALYANEKKELDMALELLQFDDTDSNFVQETPVIQEHPPIPVVKEVAPTPKPPTLLDKLKDVTLGPQALTLFKDEQTGRTRVLMRVSNMFKDRHGEIITSEAHKGFVRYLDSNPDKMPEFWAWHEFGSRWGQADAVDFSDGFLTASGLVDEGMDHVAKALARRDYGVSHGFRGVSLTGKGFIDAYASFEFSPLPRDKAANIITGVMMLKEKGMNKEKRQAFLNIGIPEETLVKWEADSRDISEVLIKEFGIQFKDTEPEPEPEPEPVPTPPGEPTLADVLGQITKLVNRMDAQENVTKELASKVDDSVASVLEAAIAPGQTKGHVATQSKDNKPSDEQVKKDDTWLNELLLKGV